MLKWTGGSSPVRTAVHRHSDEIRVRMQLGLPTDGRREGVHRHRRVQGTARSVFAVLFQHARIVLLQMQRHVLRTRSRRAHVQAQGQHPAVADFHQQVLRPQHVDRRQGILGRPPGSAQRRRRRFRCPRAAHLLRRCQRQDHLPGVHQRNRSEGGHHQTR